MHPKNNTKTKVDCWNKQTYGTLALEWSNRLFHHVLEIAKKKNLDDEKFVWKELYEDDEEELSENFYTPSYQDENTQDLELSSLKC